MENEKYLIVQTALSNLDGLRATLLEGYSNKSDYYLQVSTAAAVIKTAMERYLEVNKDEKEWKE